MSPGQAKTGAGYLLRGTNKRPEMTLRRQVSECGDARGIQGKSSDIHIEPARDCLQGALPMTVS